MFADLKDRLLAVLGDGPQMTMALHNLTSAKDCAVRQAVRDAER